MQLGPDGSYVYVVTPDNKAEMHPVMTGPTESGMTLLKQGLDLGEKVVTDGQYRLQPDSSVTTMPPKAEGREVDHHSLKETKN